MLPTPVLRLGIRSLLRRRLETAGREASVAAWTAVMAKSAIAVDTAVANAQHYEVPPEFFELVLGPNLKYSCGLWLGPDATLTDAEAAMLQLTIARADLRDGQRILELGCGWGSLSLRMAQRFPRSRIVAVSNSTRQREYIARRARAEGLANLTAVTADMNTFEPEGRFDRVVSVEMFEHMRNWPALLGRIQRWLSHDGELFVHVFVHSRFPYPFETSADDDWMGRHFFTGGMMPSDDLLPSVAAPMQVAAHWHVDGRHYARTAAAWRRRLVARRADVLALFARDLGRREAARAYHRWRLFFLACEELFGYRDGREWFVSHYRLRQPAGTS